MTEHAPEVNVQLGLLKLPLPLLEKLTVPVGVAFVPPSESLIVAVQVVGTPTLTDAGAQLTAVAVVRGFTVNV